MKTLFTLLLLCLLSGWLTAQIQRGDRLLQLGTPLTPGSVGSAGNLANVSYNTSSSDGAVSASTRYGFALSDRFVLGAGVSAIQRFGQDRQFVPNNQGGWRINPYLRYYAVNRSDLLIFGEVGTGVNSSNDLFDIIADDYSGRIGASIPLTSGILASPTLSYSGGKGRNTLALGLNLEIVLGRNTRGEDAAVASFGKGSLMLGGQSAGFNALEGSFSGGLTVGGHHFLTDRLTVGSTISLGGTSLEQEALGQFPAVSSESLNYGLGVGSRYYFTTGRRLVYFGEAGAQYSADRTTFTSGGVDSEFTFTFFTTSAGVGAQYFLRDNFALEAGPSYQHISNSDFKLSSITLKLGAQFFL